MTPTLHPWLSTPEAAKAARQSVRIPLNLLGMKAMIVGQDELLSEAYAILTECALPPRERIMASCAKCGGSLENVRRGAKFCSRLCKDLYGKKVSRGTETVLPAQAGSHIGSMWEWPEEQRQQYAVREVGYRLNNWLRTQHHVIETPASDSLANMDVASERVEESPADLLASLLESKGLRLDGTETFAELADAAVNLGLVSSFKAAGALADYVNALEAVAA